MRLTIHPGAGLSTAVPAAVVPPAGPCPQCGSTEGISVLGLDGDSGEVEAETCERCRRYVTVVDLESPPANGALAAGAT